MQDHQQQIEPHIGVFDGVSIIVGIVIGVGIFKAPMMVYSHVSSVWIGLGVWTIGGVLALVGALCFAELASAYPRSGGDYVYLTHAFGRFTGFMFGWAQMTILFAGSIGVMAFVFADYAMEIFPFGIFDADGNGGLIQDRWSTALAILAVVVLSGLHMVGLVLGKTVQNMLTVLKVIGLTAIVLIGLVWGQGLSSPQSVSEVSSSTSNIGFALIMVLYAFGGWNDAALISSEIKNPSRNIVRVLLYGTGGVLLIYLVINLGYIWGLGFEGLRTSGTPATALVSLVAGESASKLMGVLVAISALGAIHGLIYTGSRIYSVFGEDFRLFSFLAYRHERVQTPVWALSLICALTIILTLIVGTQSGRTLMDSLSLAISGAAIPWETYGGRFETLVSGTAPVFWMFFLLTGVSLFVLRYKDPKRQRPFCVPLYPVTPVLFCATSAYMLYSSLQWAKWLSLLGIMPLLAGILVYFCWCREVRK